MMAEHGDSLHPEHGQFLAADASDTDSRIIEREVVHLCLGGPGFGGEDLDGSRW